MTARMMAVGIGLLLVMGGAIRVLEAAEYKALESRLFDGVSYDGKTRTLTLLFDSGSAYAYHEVPRKVYDDLLRIVNHGEYFHRNIRKVYRFERLDGYPAAWCVRD